MVDEIKDKYSAVASELEKIDDVRFFAVLKMDDITDRWSLLFGVLNVKNLDKRKKIFDKIREIIAKNLSKNELEGIARIGLFPTTDHIVRDLKKFPAGKNILQVKANGNFVHEGCILISKKTAKEVANEQEAIQASS